MNQQKSNLSTRKVRFSIVIFSIFSVGFASAQMSANVEQQRKSEVSESGPSEISKVIPAAEKIVVTVEGDAIVTGKGFDSTKVQVNKLPVVEASKKKKATKKTK